VARALIRTPTLPRAGDVVEIRVLLQHPMETGFRPGVDGQVLPRDICTRVEARFEGELVFAADLFPAIAANPYIAFPMRITGAGNLVLSFSGDKGFEHRETAAIRLA
jgi:sulfur-oxidizing protein SoxZ